MNELRRALRGRYALPSAGAAQHESQPGTVVVLAVEVGAARRGDPDPLDLSMSVLRRLSQRVGTTHFASRWHDRQRVGHLSTAETTTRCQGQVCQKNKFTKFAESWPGAAPPNLRELAKQAWEHILPRVLSCLVTRGYGNCNAEPARKRMNPRAGRRAPRSPRGVDLALLERHALHHHRLQEGTATN